MKEKIDEFTKQYMETDYLNDDYPDLLDEAMAIIDSLQLHLGDEIEKVKVYEPTICF